MTSAGLKPALPAVKQLQTYALDPTATAMRIIPSLNLRYVISYTTYHHYHHHLHHIQSEGIWQIPDRLGKALQFLLLASKWYPIS